MCARAVGPRSEYAAGWQRRLDSDTRHQQKRTQQAVAAARACAEVLHEKYGTRRVYLVGSLAGSDTAHSGSDIDLVVEGLAPHDYFKALTELWRLLPRGVDLDLIPYEDAAPELKDRARHEGVILNA